MKFCEWIVGKVRTTPVLEHTQYNTVEKQSPGQSTESLSSFLFLFPAFHWLVCGEFSFFPSLYSFTHISLNCWVPVPVPISNFTPNPVVLLCCRMSTWFLYFRRYQSRAKDQRKRRARGDGSWKQCRGAGDKKDTLLGPYHAVV